jgi:hypothetical protein
MKLTLKEFIHRLLFVFVSFAWTIMFFLLMEQMQMPFNKVAVLVTGVIGFIILGKYDIKFFKGRWW